jgi:hypothetical protein
MNHRVLSAVLSSIVGLAGTTLATAQSNNNAPVPAQQAASGAKAGAVLKAQQPKSGQQQSATNMKNRATQSQQSQSQQGQPQPNQQADRQEKASRISSKVLKSTQDAASAVAGNVK